MKILFLTNIPSPYRVEFFNELGKSCELTVIFERTESSERDASWKDYNITNFKPIVLTGVKRGVANAVCPGVLKYIKKNQYDHIIVSNFTSYTGMLAISWMRIKHMDYWLESDGGFAKSGKGFKEKLKTHFIKGAIGYFSTAKEHDRYYLQYGAAEDRIWRYPFTSLQRKDILKEPVTAEQKSLLRKELEIKESRVLIAVGQFIHRKGFDILIDAMAMLPKEIGCYIIGGRPTEEYLRQVSDNKLENIHFVGFKTKPELIRFYMAGDMLVHPTREDIWGLVINEAMAKGMPVVTTDRCIAGLELIKSIEQGMIVPTGDAQKLAGAITTLLEQQGNNARKQILMSIGDYCFEEMARRHIEVLSGQTKERNPYKK